tara:strand:- start:9998 stop:10978 length:981 start_codon:yes stop_codon:yes gene_type:complete
MAKKPEAELFFPSTIKSVVSGEQINDDTPLICRVRSYDPSAAVGNPMKSESSPKHIFYLPAPVALNNAYGIEFDTLGVGALGQLLQGIIAAPSADGFVEGVTEVGNAVATAGTRVISDILDATGANIFRRKYGFSFNKYNELSISKPNLRTFNLSFDFAPFSEEDAGIAEKLIKLLKLGMYPTTEKFLRGDNTTVTEGQGSLGGNDSLFNPIYRNPLKYVIDFIFRGKKDEQYTKIYKTAPCFITALNVNYHRAGAPSYLPGGEPTMSSIDLTFNEIFPLTRESLREIEGMNENVVQLEGQLVLGEGDGVAGEGREGDRREFGGNQ